MVKIAQMKLKVRETDPSAFWQKIRSKIEELGSETLYSAGAGIAEIQGDGKPYYPNKDWYSHRIKMIQESEAIDTESDGLHQEVRRTGEFANKLMLGFYVDNANLTLEEKKIVIREFLKHIHQHHHASIESISLRQSSHPSLLIKFENDWEAILDKWVGYSS